MTIESAGLYTLDGRQRGSYVYMVLWQIEEPILIKLGRSCTPLSGIERLIEARVISVLEVASLKAAVRIEAELSAAIEKWHSFLGWFTVLPHERSEFNAALRPVVAAHSSRSRRIHWNSYPIPGLIASARERRDERQRSFMGRPAQYHDYRTRNLVGRGS